MTPYDVSAGSSNFPNMKLAIAKSIKALAETGHNVIVDIVFCGQKTYTEFMDELNGFNLKIFKLECPLDELTKRELARGNRAIGLAASQFESIHEGVLYDMHLNTFNYSPSQCAQKIIETEF
jgi:chloramphenicol 3-O phosphotransferase